MDITKISNTKPVDEFVSYIRNRLQGANRNWIEIAEAFAEAEEMYGSGSERFKQLREQTNFSRSKIAKLLAIVNSERLKRYAVKLASVQSWGTLYAISSLTHEQFEKLKQKYELDNPSTVAPFISQTDVDKIRKGEVKRSFFRGYVSIQVDDEAVKGGLLSGVEFEQLEKLLGEIEALSSYVNLKRTDIEEKAEVSRLQLIMEKVKQVTRRRYVAAINATLERRKKTKGENRNNLTIRCFGKSETELMTDLQVDPEQAFEAIGANYDMATFYNDAEDEVNKAERAKMDKFAKKVINRPVVENEATFDHEEAIDPYVTKSLKEREKQEALKQKLKAVFAKAA